MNTTVLICDDNYAVHESLKSYLITEGIEPVSAYTGEEALDILDRKKVDLVILDIMLPGIFGTEVCRQIRSRSNVPIIMLSALDSEEDRVSAFKLGADDYVTKPFSPREISARVFAVLRRTSPMTVTKKYHFEELTVDVDAFSVWVGTQKIDLSPNETKMLAYLIENKNIVLSRERLLNAIWGYDYVGDTRAVDAQIKRLRRKLPSEGVNFRITSVYGVGFKLEKISEKEYE